MIGPNELLTRRRLLELSDAAFDSLVAELREAREAQRRRADGVQRSAAAFARKAAAASEENRLRPVADPMPYGSPGGRVA